jgi:hypothetical protein
MGFNRGRWILRRTFWEYSKRQRNGSLSNSSTHSTQTAGAVLWDWVKIFAVLCCVAFPPLGLTVLAFGLTKSSNEAKRPPLSVYVHCNHCGAEMMRTARFCMRCRTACSGTEKDASDSPIPGSPLERSAPQSPAPRTASLGTEKAARNSPITGSTMEGSAPQSPAPSVSIHCNRCGNEIFRKATKCIQCRTPVDGTERSGKW